MLYRYLGLWHLNPLKSVRVFTALERLSCSASIQNLRFVLCFMIQGKSVMDDLNLRLLLRLLTILLLLLCVLHRQAYKWTGDNLFFIKGDMDSLAFGGGRSVTLNFSES